MACPKKESTGSCGHYQCPYSDKTAHGYECVDILTTDIGAFCEVGEGCYSECQFSFKKDDGSTADKANAEWIRNFDPSL
jgi:hypothetical protein